jgi:hypothetical protein
MSALASPTRSLRLTVPQILRERCAACRRQGHAMHYVKTGVVIGPSVARTLRGLYAEPRR